ncbi:MAG: S8 family serine peptidase [Flavobacteriales bacterium]
MKPTKTPFICLLFFLFGMGITHAQKDNQYAFSLFEYAQKDPNTPICFSAKNTLQNQQKLRSLGISIKSQTETNLFFNAKPSEILDDFGRPKVEGIYFSFSRPASLADSALVKHNIHLVHQGLNGVDTNYTGKGVIMGVIDQGIDFNHPDFKTATGKTRVLRYWDHSVNGPNSPQPYNYGVVWDSSAINAGTCTSLETVTAHGTTVAGMAAGNARANTKNKGAAPDADIVVVETNFNLPNWTLTIADACDYIFKVADTLGKPAVINISLGDYLGSHDGDDPASDLIESLLDLSPGRIVVCAAGNSGNQGKYHVRNNQIGSDTTFFWNIPNTGMTVAGPNKIVFDLWSDTSQAHYYYGFGADKITPNFSFRGNTAFRYATSNMNQVPVTDTLYNGSGQRMAIIDSYREIVGANFHMLCVFTTIDSMAYRYRFMTTGSGQYDAWGGSWIQLSNFSSAVPSIVQFPAMQHYIMPDTLQTIVSSWNCSEKVISVANMRNRKGHITKNNTYYQPASTTPVGKLSENCSKGPARNGTTKPDITAAGDVTLAAGPLWYLSNTANNSTIDLGGFHVRNGGTSMASPVVAGIAALYLQKCPLSTYQQFKLDLTNTAIVDGYTGVTPNFAYGFGKADALALLTSKNINLSIDSAVGICVGSTATLYVNSNVPLNTIHWNNGVMGNSMTTAIVGSYYAKVLDSAGCYTRANPITLGTLTLPFVDAGASFTSCPGVPVTLLGTGTAISYAWEHGVPNNTAFIPNSSMYYVTGTGANGCENTDSVMITLFDVDPVTYHETTTSVLEGSSPFNVTAGQPAGGTYSGTGIIGSSFHPTLSGPGSFTVTYTVVDGNGCSNSDSSVINVLALNGLENQASIGLDVYPNPTGEMLFVRGIKNQTDVKLFDMQGRCVLTIKNYVSGKPINVGDLASGSYWIATEAAQLKWVKF